MVRTMMIWFIMIGFLLDCSSKVTEKADTADRPLAESLSKNSSKAQSPESSSGDADTLQYLFKMEGFYTLADSGVNCKMDLHILRKKDQFRYRLKTATRQLHGNVLLKLNEEKDGYYITLQGIEWSEYGGAIDPDEGEEESSDDVALPQEVEGVFYEDEISIQNTGNAMNYYVKFGDCDLKYIHLIKKTR